MGKGHVASCLDFPTVFLIFSHSVIINVLYGTKLLKTSCNIIYNIIIKAFSKSPWRMFTMWLLINFMDYSQIISLQTSPQPFAATAWTICMILGSLQTPLAISFIIIENRN